LRIIPDGGQVAQYGGDCCLSARSVALFCGVEKRGNIFNEDVARPEFLDDTRLLAPES
jgi:hypothetical protein